MSTAAHVEHPTSDFPEYLRILRTRKWSVIIVLVLLVGAAYAYSARQTPIYQGTARVLVLPMSNPVSGGNQTRNNPIDMPTEQQVATGEPVATLVQKDLHITTPISTLLKHLKVTVVMNTDVLNFAYQDPSKTTAATVANRKKPTQSKRCASQPPLEASTVRAVAASEDRSAYCVAVYWMWQRLER